MKNNKDMNGVGKTSQRRDVDFKSARYVSPEYRKNNKPPLCGYEKDQILDYVALYEEASKGARFLDTIELSFPCEKLQDPRAGGILKHSAEEREKGFEFHTYHGKLHTSSGADVYIRYQPWQRDRCSHISFTFSLPKVIIGNNYEAIPIGIDIFARLQAEFLPIFKRLGIHPVNLVLCEVTRIDFCVNYQVGADLDRYLAFVATRHCPRRKRGPYNDNTEGPKGVDTLNNGVCFQTKSKLIRTSLYDKEEECGDPKSCGILRLERSCRKRKYVKQAFRCMETPRLIDLTTEIVQGILQTDLFTLGLDTPIRSTKDCLDVLRTQFSPTQSINMWAFLMVEQQHPGLSNKDLAKKTGWSPKTIWKRRKELKDKGLSFNPVAEVDLPALTLDALDDFDQEGEVDSTAASARTLSDDKNVDEVPHNILLPQDLILIQHTAGMVVASPMAQILSPSPIVELDCSSIPLDLPKVILWVPSGRSLNAGLLQHAKRLLWYLTRRYPGRRAWTKRNGQRDHNN